MKAQLRLAPFLSTICANLRPYDVTLKPTDQLISVLRLTQLYHRVIIRRHGFISIEQTFLATIRLSIGP